MKSKFPIGFAVIVVGLAFIGFSFAYVSERVKNDKAIKMKPTEQTKPETEEKMKRFASG